MSTIEINPFENEPPVERRGMDQWQQEENERLKQPPHPESTAAMQAEISILRAHLAEHESNQRAYEEIIGKKTYREVADQLARARRALEIAKDAIEFYGLDDFEEITERTLRDIESALKDLP